MKNTADNYEYNYDDIDEYGVEIDEWHKRLIAEKEEKEKEYELVVEEEKKGIDHKTARNLCFEKRVGSRIQSTVKAKRSKTAQEKKKKEQKLPKSIIIHRKAQYVALKQKRHLVVAS